MPQEPTHALPDTLLQLLQAADNALNKAKELDQAAAQAAQTLTEAQQNTMRANEEALTAHQEGNSKAMEAIQAMKDHFGLPS